MRSRGCKATETPCNRGARSNLKRIPLGLKWPQHIDTVAESNISQRLPRNSCSRSLFFQIPTFECVVFSSWAHNRSLLQFHVINRIIIFRTGVSIFFRFERDTISLDYFLRWKIYFLIMGVFILGNFKKSRIRV